MAGIYLHIPFCKQACHYCDFHFSTNTKTQAALVEAMQRELHLRRDFLPEQAIKTIYFGGGTPSILSGDELGRLLSAIHALWDVAADAEVTLEANPDDLTPEKLEVLRQAGINRLSIGIQSFVQEHLDWMNRAHNANQAAQCIDAAQQAGFDNLTVDLIYGFPLLSDEQWSDNIQRVIDRKVPHISCYSLTVEPHTALAHFIAAGKTQPPDDAQSIRHFDILLDTLEAAGYSHYEISNFALPGHESRHNRSYWTGAGYLGIGPSAHSFDGQRRCWNVRNNHRYIQSLKEGTFAPECETIDQQTAYNEYLLTRLRTAAGIDTTAIYSRFGIDFNTTFKRQIARLSAEEKLEQDGDNFRLTRLGKCWADDIAASFFIVSE